MYILSHPSLYIACTSIPEFAKSVATGKYYKMSVMGSARFDIAEVNFTSPAPRKGFKRTVKKVRLCAIIHFQGHTFLLPDILAPRFYFLLS